MSGKKVLIDSQTSTVLIYGNVTNSAKNTWQDYYYGCIYSYQTLLKNSQVGGDLETPCNVVLMLICNIWTDEPYLRNDNEQSVKKNMRKKILMTFNFNWTFAPMGYTDWPGVLSEKRD